MKEGKGEGGRTGALGRKGHWAVGSERPWDGAVCPARGREGLVGEERPRATVPLSVSPSKGLSPWGWRVEDSESDLGSSGAGELLRGQDCPAPSRTQAASFYGQQGEPQRSSAAPMSPRAGQDKPGAGRVRPSQTSPSLASSR